VTLEECFTDSWQQSTYSCFTNSWQQSIYSCRVAKIQKMPMAVDDIGTFFIGLIKRSHSPLLTSKLQAYKKNYKKSYSLNMTETCSGTI